MRTGVDHTVLQSEELIDRAVDGDGVDDGTGPDIDHPGGDPQLVSDALIRADEEPRRTTRPCQPQRGLLVDDASRVRPQRFVDPLGTQDIEPRHTRQLRRQRRHQPGANPPIRLGATDVRKRDQPHRLTLIGSRRDGGWLTGLNGGRHDECHGQAAADADC